MQELSYRDIISATLFSLFRFVYIEDRCLPLFMEPEVNVGLACIRFLYL